MNEINARSFQSAKAMILHQSFLLLCVGSGAVQEFNTKMKSLIKSSDNRSRSLLVALALGMLSFFPASAWSDVLTLGYVFETPELKVEIKAAEVVDGAEYQESISGVSEELKKDHLANPDAPIELGWISGPDAGRDPSGVEEAKSRPARFIQKVKERLANSGVHSSREGGIDLDPKRDLKPSVYQKLNQAYLDHSNITWTIVRVVTNTGVRVATLMYAGLNFYQAMTVGLGVFTACSAVAWNSKHLLHFEENFRIYNVFSRQKFPKFRALLDSPKYEKRISRPHYFLNWGLLEVMFGAAILLGENTARSLWGLELDVPNLIPFVTSTVLSTASQGVADLAVAKYEILAKNSGMEKRLLDANFYKRLAFNSIASVAGFTMTNTSFLPIQVTGYVFLGALSTYGFVYSKLLDRRALRSADPCLQSLTPEE